MPRVWTSRTAGGGREGGGNVDVGSVGKWEIRVFFWGGGGTVGEEWKGNVEVVFWSCRQARQERDKI